MKNNSSALHDRVLTLAGVAVLLFGARYAADIVVPFLLALFIAVIARGPIEWLKKRGLPSSLAVGFVILAVIAVNVLVAVMLGATIEQFNEALPNYQKRLSGLTQNVVIWLDAHGVDASKAGIQKVLNPGMAMGFVNTMLGSLAGVMSNALLIIFTVMMMLVEAEGFSRKVLLMKGGAGESSMKRLSRIMESMNQYVGAKAFISLITASLVYIGLKVVGLDFAILWAFLAFVLNFIPNIGSIMAAVPAVLLALVQLSATSALVVAGIYVAVNVGMGNMVEPMLMGKRVGLSALFVFLSLIFWGWLFGPVGMLLSVPLTMVVKIVAEGSKETRWLAVLLGPAPEEGD
ncbi:MAG: AI-2E family transporter [Verrucomicrobiales bacterium]|nr:AI-2E family transporter [Verrucomicrobiales bacterium]